ncbi:PREDICTED: odorant receptor 13a-like [Dinoponera quadriceps]|uniref:Odorant receptor n=1 Tax=Dinoponera quadriceps TaxID=609295 RepID=A0A6P3Y0S4_DINQU|nr:PREDICTED: odorant receptor 13a-like [Dinoponera quadriceps]
MSTVCRSVEFGLRVIGMWPGTSISRGLSYISLMAMFQVFQYRYLFAHFSEQDLSLFMDVLSATMAYSLLFIKLILLACNARLLDEIIACVAEDWKERDASDEHAMTRMAFAARRFSNLIIASGATSVLFYATGTLMLRKNDNRTVDRELFLKMDLPFDIENGSVYVAVLVTQFIHQMSAAGILAMLDALLLTLVLHVCGQIDIVQQKLSTITRKDIERDTCMVKILVIRHQRIISFSKNIETLFSKIALIQFLSDTLIICCLGFLIVISINIPNGTTMLVKSVLFYISIGMQAFIFCFVGEYLSSKVSVFIIRHTKEACRVLQSEMIGDAAYESLWYDLKPNENRDLFFMIVRSQKRLTLTAGKFVNLSLRQFGNIVKASASYMSVLHAMY